MPEMMKLEMTVMGMKHRIVTALTEHTQNLDQDIKTAVEQVVERFDAESIVRKYANDVLDRSIKKAIEQAVEEAIKQSVPFKNRLKAGISIALDESPELPEFGVKAQTLFNTLEGFDNAEVSVQVLEDTLRDMWYLGRRGW